MFSKLSQIAFVFIILLITLKLCCLRDENLLMASTNIDNSKILINTSKSNYVTIEKDIPIAEYFQFLDSFVKQYNLKASYKFTEHILVRANPWIIDSLQNTDYYRMMKRDSFVYNQKKMIVLKKGSKLLIPDSLTVVSILNLFQKTIIDINIPEFKLRIYNDSIKLYEFSVRVGKNEKKYLKMGDRITDLKTKTGKGTIVNHVRNPEYFNPVNGHQYFVTKRDDNKVTQLPQIPFIETEINGFRYGQLIHPTTNPITLGKTSSNGCIGTREADAWVIYYFAPIGTKVNIRYDLKINNGDGEKTILEDIYDYY